MKFPFAKEALSALFKSPSTEKYPFVKKEAPEGYRGKIAYDPSKCVNCGLCMRVCAPGAITRTIEKTEDGDKITFQFYMGSCTFCQMCADFCGKKAIQLTKEYSMIATNEEDLMVRGTFIKKMPPKPPVAPKPTAPTPVGQAAAQPPKSDVKVETPEAKKAE